MENASKALIIAGSILISILIIGVGVMIFGNVSDIFKTGTVDEQAVQTYNEPFTRYGGSQITGSQVKALCEAIRNHNLTYATDESKLITLTQSGAATDRKASEAPGDAAKTNTISGIKNGIKSGYTYNVQFGYDPTTGYITNVDVKQNT